MGLKLLETAVNQLYRIIASQGSIVIRQVYVRPCYEVFSSHLDILSHTLISPPCKASGGDYSLPCLAAVTSISTRLALTTARPCARSEGEAGISCHPHLPH